jgi:hypothetical protein
VCNCGIRSSTLAVTGSGSFGDPYVLETNAFAIVTSLTRPAGFNGQHIYETDTDRDAVYDGTNWVYLNNLPQFSIENTSTQSIANNTGTTPAMPTEVQDTDGFHTSTNGFITIPSGLGGRYTIFVHGNWAADATSFRSVRPVIGNNTGITQNNTERSGGYAMVSTALNGFPVATTMLLRAAATVTVNVFQLSGAALDLSTVQLRGIMTHHRPDLV